MTPEEAESCDPQQRWLLEVAYEAFENGETYLLSEGKSSPSDLKADRPISIAGIPMDQVSGSRTSVYIGSFMRDYEIMLMRDPEMHAKYKMTGTGSAMLANRISWFYNLTGPSMSLDTACSSSLNALHIACQSIHNGEAEMVRK